MTYNLRDKDDVVNAAYLGLARKEGNFGDTTGAAITLNMGMTERLFERLKEEHGENTTVYQAIWFHLVDLYDSFNRVEGFAEASNKLKVELIDLAYNAGRGVMRWKGLRSSLAAFKEGLVTETDVIKNILDSANIGGKTSKGLAKRRAESYNQVADVKIAKVIQEPDGKIKYEGKDGTIIFSYGKGKGKHPSSVPGAVLVR